MNLKNGIDRDSVVTPFEGVLGETGETVCTSVAFWKLGALQETKVERFPKLDVAGSIPVSRSNFSGTWEDSKVPSTPDHSVKRQRRCLRVVPHSLIS
jgi:hypothetical protein